MWLWQARLWSRGLISTSVIKMAVNITGPQLSPIMSPRQHNAIRTSWSSWNIVDIFCCEKVNINYDIQDLTSNKKILVLGTPISWYPTIFSNTTEVPKRTTLKNAFCSSTSHGLHYPCGFSEFRMEDAIFPHKEILHFINDTLDMKQFTLQVWRTLKIRNNILHFVQYQFDKHIRPRT